MDPDLSMVESPSNFDLTGLPRIHRQIFLAENIFYEFSLVPPYSRVYLDAEWDTKDRGDQGKIVKNVFCQKNLAVNSRRTCQNRIGLGYNHAEIWVIFGYSKYLGHPVKSR
jgi:hypothetical protein